MRKSKTLVALVLAAVLTLGMGTSAFAGTTAGPGVSDVPTSLYQVALGDTLAKIAEVHYGSTTQTVLDAIIWANTDYFSGIPKTKGILQGIPEPGEYIELPSYFIHVVGNGQTLEQIATLFYGRSTAANVQAIKTYNAAYFADLAERSETVTVEAYTTLRIPPLGWLLTTAGLSSVVPPAPQRVSDQLYTVAKGETFEDIAKAHYGNSTVATVDALRAANLNILKSKSGVLEANEVIIIPSVFTHIVEPKQTLEQIAAAYYGSSSKAYVDTIIAANASYFASVPFLEAYVSLRIPRLAYEGVSYMVQSGQTFEEIAVNYYGSASAAAKIRAANHDYLVQTDGVLIAGTQIWLPADGIRVPVTQGGGFVYTVKAGDTLSGVASFFYGDAKYVGKIVAANGATISGSTAGLTAGQWLIIPR